MTQAICKAPDFPSSFAFDLAWLRRGHYPDERLAHGLSYFVGEEARSALGVSQLNFAAAVTRLINKGRLANPRHGYFLILRPEDRIAGAPDPARWIDPLMKHQGLAYRVKWACLKRLASSSI